MLDVVQAWALMSEGVQVTKRCSALIDRSSEACVVDVDDDEQEEEEENEEEGGEGEEEEEEEEGEWEGRFCLGQEHDSRAVREREGSQWPPDH